MRRLFERILGEGEARPEHCHQHRIGGAEGARFEREREEKLLRRAKEDGEHEAAEKESPSKIPEIEEQVAGLNAGDEV